MSENVETAAQAEAAPVARRNRRTLQGTVVSTAMNKTVVVKVTTHVPHPQYRKYTRKTNKYHVHDEREDANVGDLVTIVETRPMSKRKRWQLRSIDRKAVG